MTITGIAGPTIQAGETLSDGIDCRAGEIVRLSMPADWTPANLTFQVSTDGKLFDDLFDDQGEEITVKNVAPGSAVTVPRLAARAIAFLKFRSGSRAHPVVQKGRREFAVTVDTAARQAA